MPLPPLHIGNLTARVPIIQGGMGVGISRAGLASAVARAGGIGILATVGLGLISPYYQKPADFFPANVQALRDEIIRAQSNAGGGIIGINCMVAVTDYEKLVRTSVENGVKLIVSGAGLPLTLPEYVKEFPDVALAPIVSTGKAASVLFRKWERNYGRIPDAIIVESPNYAGGHLGADFDELGSEELETDNAVSSVLAFLRNTVKVDIPVIAAGGIWDRADIDRMFNLGCAGVQMGTRFVCTHECDAAMAFKQTYLDCTEEDIVIIRSPVGLPGRAYRNERFMDESRVHKMQCMANCLKKCSYLKNRSGFCIAIALESAAKGDTDNGLVFMGKNAYKCNRIVSVKELMDELNA